MAEVKDPLTGETQLDLDGYYVKNGKELDGFPVWYNDVKVLGKNFQKTFIAWKDLGVTHEKVFSCLQV